MADPKIAVRVLFPCEPEVLAALKKLEDFPGTRPLFFFVDEGNQKLNIVMSADSRAVAVSLMNAAAEGGLQTRDHGLWHGWKDEP